MMFTHELKNYTDEKNILINEKLSKHCTFKTGGTCSLVVLPENTDELIKIIGFLKSKNTAFEIIGNGSNILFPDGHLDKVIIKTTRLNNITVFHDEITAEAGARLTSVCNAAYENSLTGMECLNGIPGTVGGAVYMNAGAYGGEIKDVCIKTFYLDDNLDIKEKSFDEHEFSYRHSFFSDKKYVILKSVLKLQKGDKTKIKEKMAEYIEKRNEKQPLNFPNAGSTFKRPEGYFAGKLIEDCGLKGYSIGDACVSEKHSGFIVNKGNATTTDVLKLIKHVQSEVKNKFGVELETEVRIIK